jgi:hypothetical protein
VTGGTVTFSFVIGWNQSAPICPAARSSQYEGAIESSGPCKHTPLADPRLAVACCLVLIGKQQRRLRPVLQSRE